MHLQTDIFRQHRRLPTAKLRKSLKRLHGLYRRFLMVVFFLGLAGHARSSWIMVGPPVIGLPSTIAVTSELVMIPVNVTDRDGNFVSGLSKDNFRVYEGKKLQSLTSFEQEDTPVSVGLIVDHSASMQTKLPDALASILAFAKSANPKDEMFVVTFNDKVALDSLGGKSFSSDPEELANAIKAVSASGRTALYDAVAVGLNHLQLSHEQKKALIIISDGGDNASSYKRSEILALARQSHVEIYSIVLVDDFEKEQNPGALWQLCIETGGIAFSPTSRETTTSFSERIAEDLREQYTLGFVPEHHGGGGSFHKLQVRVVAPGREVLRVRTRSGYSRVESKTAAGF